MEKLKKGDIKSIIVITDLETLKYELGDNITRIAMFDKSYICWNKNDIVVRIDIRLPSIITYYVP